MGTRKAPVPKSSDDRKRKFEDTGSADAPATPAKKPSPKRTKLLLDSDLSLSAKISKAAENLGIADTGVPYTVLIRKLLETEWLFGKVKDSVALVALQENGGNLNRTRHALKTSLHLA